MAKHTAIAEAVKALVAAALPNSRVKGIDPDDAKPTAVDPLGTALVRRNEIGDPIEITFSPPTWWWERPFTVELAAPKDGTRSEQEIRDAMLAAIGAAIGADRQLGGLCDWIEASAPLDGEADARGAQPIGWTDFDIVVSYSTLSPLG